MLAKTDADAEAVLLTVSESVRADASANLALPYPANVLRGRRALRSVLGPDRAAILRLLLHSKLLPLVAALTLESKTARGEIPGPFLCYALSINPYFSAAIFIGSPALSTAGSTRNEPPSVTLSITGGCLRIAV